MDRKEVYGEEYISILNDTLRKHNNYKDGFEITLSHLNGLVFKCNDKILPKEDKEVFEEVVNSINEKYKLIIT